MQQPASKAVVALPPSAVVTQSRMTLKSIVKGKKAGPQRIVLYGVEKIGKSTFAASAPDPVFIGAEDGIGRLDVAKFEDPRPEAWPDIIDAVQVLGTQDHQFKTIVLDTLDWAEPLLWRFICERDGKTDIEDYGFGKGYTAALDEWRKLVANLERAWRQKGMHVILLAHANIKSFKNPEGPDYDRYTGKIHAQAFGLVKEWADTVLFANYETVVDKDAKTKRAKGLSTGARTLYAVRHAAYDAGNRDNLPEEMPLQTWAEFWTAAEAGNAKADAFQAEIAAKCEQLAAEHKKTATDYLAKADKDATKLAQVLNWVNSKLNEKGTN